MLLDEIMPQLADSNVSEALEEGTKRGFRIRGGKKQRIKVNSKLRARKMSSKQKRALRKNRRKAHRSGAKRQRKRSVKIRGRKNIKSIAGGQRRKRRSSNR